jgi:hypothetical protein
MVSASDQRADQVPGEGAGRFRVAVHRLIVPLGC